MFEDKLVFNVVCLKSKNCSFVEEYEWDKCQYKQLETNFIFVSQKKKSSCCNLAIVHDSAETSVNPQSGLKNTLFNPD